MRMEGLWKCLLVLSLLLSSCFQLSGQAFEAIRVAGDWQRWADVDGNGTLERREMGVLVSAMTDLLSAPHRGASPLDARFDVNGNGRIDPDELQRARMEYFKPQLLALSQANPEMARRVDLNLDGKIDEREAQQLTEYLFLDERARVPHRVEDPADRRADLNNDGRTGGEEFLAYREQLILAVAVLPWAREDFPRMPGGEPAPGISDAQRWADGDGDGKLNAREAEALVAAVMELLMGPHPGRTPLDGMFDANKNGRIDPDELERARLEYFKPRLIALVPLNPEAARFIDLNDDGGIDDREAQQVLEYLFVDAKARGPHPVQTPVDRRADLNHDGRTGGDEYLAYRDRLVRAVALLPWGMGKPGRKLGVPAEPTIVERREPGGEPASSEAAASVPPSGEVKLGISAKLDQIFPIFLKYYDTAPIGTLTLTNEGSVDLENLKVQLIVKEYMTDKKLCGSIDRLKAGEKKDLSLYALFTRSVLDISEATKAQANISVEYAAAGQSKTEERVETISFLNRNNMTWDDDRRVAAFVTKNDPSVMLFRSFAVAGVEEAVTAIDENLRTAIAVHEAISLYGVKYWADPKGSYATRSTAKDEVDYLQFPAQTLQLKTGDCDDLAILWSALLEASSVATAFVTVPGHIFVAFELQMTPAEARKSALTQEDLIYTRDKVWVPVEVTSIKDGFLKAWQAGAKEWRDASARATPGFNTFAEASARFAPVGFTASSATLSLPEAASLARSYAAELKSLVDREIATQLAAVQAEIAKNKEKPGPLNKLGVLYAKYGLSAQAETQFSAALKLSSSYVPALVNLGNLAFLKGDAKSARQYYEKAQKKEPDNPSVLLGIARVNHEQENYGEAKEAYEKLKALDSSLAARFAYLDLRGSDATRAADVAGVARTVVWDEE